MMMKSNESFAQLLKMEIMERYGLREDQVRLELNIHTADLDLGRQVLADFNRSKTEEILLPENKNCDYVNGEQVNQVWVHRKDGFYGAYVINEEGADNDEC